MGGVGGGAWPGPRRGPRDPRRWGGRSGFGRRLGPKKGEGHVIIGHTMVVITPGPFSRTKRGRWPVSGGQKGCWLGEKATSPPLLSSKKVDWGAGVPGMENAGGWLLASGGGTSLHD